MTREELDARRCAALLEGRYVVHSFDCVPMEALASTCEWCFVRMARADLRGSEDGWLVKARTTEVLPPNGIVCSPRMAARFGVKERRTNGGGKRVAK